MKVSKAVLISLVILLITSFFTAQALAFQPTDYHKLAVDGADNLYTWRTSNSSQASGPGYIHVYAPDGGEVRAIPLNDSWSWSEFTVDSAGNLYLLNCWQNTVTRVDHDGIAAELWNASENASARAYTLAVDGQGNLYLGELASEMRGQQFVFNGTEILRISPSGKLLQAYRDAHSQAEYGIQISVSDNGTIYSREGLWDNIVSISPNGTRSPLNLGSPKDSPIKGVADVEIGRDGFLYVVDYPGQVEKFSPDGTFIARWTGCGPEPFNGPTRVAVDKNGRVYVEDSNNGRIVWFDGNQYVYGDNVYKNAAGKGDLWDTPVTWEPEQWGGFIVENVTVTAEPDRAEKATPAPGFTFLGAVLGLVALGAVLLRK